MLGVLGQRPSDATAVRTVLVELDTCLADAARHRAEDQGIANVDVRTADAGNTRAYADAVPADLLLLCGIFGNVSDEDVRRTVAAVPRLVGPDATVIWTRSRRAPDLTPADPRVVRRRRLRGACVQRTNDELFSVGVSRFTGTPAPLEDETVLFGFATGLQPPGGGQ